MVTSLEELPVKFRGAVRVLEDIDSKKHSLRRSMAKLTSLSPEYERETKGIYALTMNTLENRGQINEMKKVCIKASRVKLNEPLLEIIIGKMIFEKKCTIYSLPQEIAETSVVVEKRRTLAGMKGNKPQQPHIYLRINRLKTKMPEIISELKENEFIHDTSEIVDFESFIANCHRLPKWGFMVDFHFPKDMLVFRRVSMKPLQSLEMYKEGKVIIQDKASLLAVKCMRLKKRMTVLDVCCAPGTKTAAMAACMKNKGKIISIDRDRLRLGEMKKLMEQLGVKCCEIVEGDFVELAKNYESMDIDVLLLDPSCSGTGRPQMSTEIIGKERIGKLAGFQTLLLKTALDLGPKKLVYSTCSTDMFENDIVVKTALKESPNGQSYRVINPLPDWPLRGKSYEPFAQDCIRSDESLLTKGFFFCIMERID